MIGKPGPLTGKVLGKRYLLGDVLGEGGFGMVYAAVQQDLGRTVAVKVLHDYRGDDLHALLRLKLEARAAAGLEHPNIVSVTDFQHHREEPAFLVMDLLRGCSLKAVLEQRGVISQRRAAYITCQVLSALMVAHKAGIIHRDLKPSNIFLIHIAGVKDIVKLLDFGIAKLQRSMLDVELTSTGSAPGTPVYMAPEQILGNEVDGRTDLYSMGVMLYRAVTGKLPFTAPNDSALVLAIMDHQYIPMSRYRQDLDPEFEAVVDRAMAKEPRDRFPSAQEMLLALMPWAPVGVRDDCLQGLRSAGAEQEAAFLYHVQDLGHGSPAEDAKTAGSGPADFNCATVTLPPDGRAPAPKAQEAPFFNEITRQKRPPTLEIVELLPDSPPAQAEVFGPVGAAPPGSNVQPGPERSTKRDAPWPRWPLVLLPLAVLMAGGLHWVTLMQDEPAEVSLLYPGGSRPTAPSSSLPEVPLVTPLPRKRPQPGAERGGAPAHKAVRSVPPRPQKGRRAKADEGKAVTAPGPVAKVQGKGQRREQEKQSAQPRGGLFVKVLNKSGEAIEAMFRVDGKGSFHAPRVVFLPPGRHLLETERPMRCTSRAKEERRRAVKFVDVTCKGQGSVKKEVEVVAGKTRPVILRLGEATASR